MTNPGINLIIAWAKSILPKCVRVPCAVLYSETRRFEIKKDGVSCGTALLEVVDIAREF
jgi:hypothetical protein